LRHKAARLVGENIGSPVSGNTLLSSLANQNPKTQARPQQSHPRFLNEQLTLRRSRP
jgi:hypothetical protein